MSPPNLQPPPSVLPSSRPSTLPPATCVLLSPRTSTCASGNAPSTSTRAKPINCAMSFPRGHDSSPPSKLTHRLTRGQEGGERQATAWDALDTFRKGRGGARGRTRVGRGCGRRTTHETGWRNERNPRGTEVWRNRSNAGRTVLLRVGNVNKRNLFSTSCECVEAEQRGRILLAIAGLVHQSRPRWSQGLEGSTHAR